MNNENPFASGAPKPEVKATTEQPKPKRRLPVFTDAPDIPSSAEKIESPEGKVSEEQKERWREILRQLPVAVNNFYGARSFNGETPSKN